MDALADGASSTIAIVSYGTAALTFGESAEEFALSTNSRSTGLSSAASALTFHCLSGGLPDIRLVVRCASSLSARFRASANAVLSDGLSPFHMPCGKKSAATTSVGLGESL